MSRNSCFQCAAWLAVFSVIAAPGLAAAPIVDGSRTSAVAQALRVVDVELDRQGAVVGQLVDVQGQPVVGALITLDNGREQVQFATNAQGMFRVTGVRGGVYRVQTGQQVQMCRIWQPGTAPPAANKGLMIVKDDQFALGQNCGSPVACGLAGCREALAHPLIFGGIVAAAIAIPVAIHNSDDDEAPAS